MLTGTLRQMIEKLTEDGKVVVQQGRRLIAPADFLSAREEHANARAFLTWADATHVPGARIGTLTLDLKRAGVWPEHVPLIYGAPTPVVPDEVEEPLAAEDVERFITDAQARDTLQEERINAALAVIAERDEEINRHHAELHRINAALAVARTAFERGDCGAAYMTIRSLL